MAFDFEMILEEHAMLNSLSQSARDRFIRATESLRTLYKEKRAMEYRREERMEDAYKIFETTSDAIAEDLNCGSLKRAVAVEAILDAWATLRLEVLPAEEVFDDMFSAAQKHYKRFTKGKAQPTLPETMTLADVIQLNEDRSRQNFNRVLAATEVVH